MKKIKIKKKNNEKIKKIKTKWKKSTIMEKILTIITFLLVAIFVAAIAFFLFIVIMAPEFDVENLYTKEASIIYDAEGNEIARLGTENRQRVSYEDLPEVFIDALVATEDSRFFQHNGVDLARFIKASIGQVLGKSDAGGASTLTMQIVKQRYTDSGSSGIKGIIRKFTDMYMSVFKLEKNYTKEQLIEFYVNIPGLGSGTYGIEQASETYFGKEIGEVSLSEAALLAGLFQAPSAYNPYDYPKKAEARRNMVLNLMERHGYITKEECEIAKSISVKSQLVSGNSQRNRNQGFINTVVEEVVDRTGKDPYLVSMKIYSTMIQEKQDIVNGIYNGDTYKWPNENIQAGLAVTDVETGALVAVGASRNKGERTYNYATMINRHPGSSAKPIFDYGPAIENLNWSTGQMVIDDTYTYSNGVSIKNWDNGYKGIMTIKNALASSRNIPALYTFQQLNQSQIDKFATDLGITPEYESGYINESHSIGGFNGVNPLQMSAAYAAFARGGIYIEPYSFTKLEILDTGETYVVTPEKRTVMSESTAYMITMILKHATTGGYVTAGTKSGTDVCSKTGTSTVDSSIKKAYNIKKAIIGDSWQVTYTPQYCYALWVGYDRITSNQYLTSSVGGAVKKAIMKVLTPKLNDSNQTFKRPSSVTTATIELETNPLQLASEYTPDNLKSVEYFKTGTVPDDVSTRFSQLSNPTNIKADYNILSGKVVLSWDSIKKPDAIDKDYLKEYYNEGYGVWANKYYEKRLEYNNNYIGNIGYHVYVKEGGSYKDLGFTTNNSFTYNGILLSTTTFMVKSSYSIFTANMSSGVTISVSPSGSTDNPSTKSWTINLVGDKTMTVKNYNNTLALLGSPVRVFEGIIDVTRNATIKTTCWNENDEEVDCNSLNCEQKYSLQHSVTYNDMTKSKTRELTPGC